ncbi:unnamed protein product, partial [Owenia fusiformis]
KNLAIHGQNINSYTRQILEEDADLKQSWIDLFQGQDLTLLQPLYIEVVSLFTRVLVKQFRKDFVSELAIEKKEALRKKVDKRESEKLTFQSVCEDTSLGKQHSHHLILSTIQ